MEQIQKRDITTELTESYLDYAMSVIVSRALPDARDGLKPVQRRILYAMREMGLTAGARFRKSATVVGSVLGAYHPHGDTSVYDAMVRLAQDFSLRYPLVQGQGNFGCFTGDTKVRLTDGRAVTFFDLVHESKSGRKHFTYTYNTDTKQIEIAEIHAPRMTEANATLVKVTLDNGENIRCTPNHSFLLRDGTYREAKDLQKDDSLMPIYARFSNEEDGPDIVNHEMILQPNPHAWSYAYYPSVKPALRHFSSDIISQAKYYNHKVILVEFLSERENVYDLTIDGTHNFALAAGIFVHNSIDGDTAAAYRYTETKLSRLAEEMLADIEKDTVDFRDNFDATHKEPAVLPTKIPQLLLNGTVGIAVGMATNIPPHNLHEVMDALLYLADHPGATTEDLFRFVQGPDFPTGAIIFDKKAILEAYATGRGPILTRGVVEVTESKKGDAQIVITAIPYQVSKSGLVAKMAELVRDKKIEGIRDLRDESDKEGMRVVIYLKADAYPQKIVNALYKYTELERSFHVNLLALNNGIQPEVMSLKTLLEAFLSHRKIVVERRTRFDLERAKERAHILEGLVKALDHIDAIIKTIRQSKDRTEAQANLMKGFALSDLQAHAILEMRLSALANLEAQKIKDELEEKRTIISSLTALLKDSKKMLAVIKDEFKEIKERYGDPRRTVVRAGSPKEIGIEDIVPEEEVVVALTRGGYIKRMNPELYRAQHRGGKGVIGVTPKEEDLVEHFVTANTHANLLFFTDAGKVYQTKAYEIPEGTRQARGKPLVGFLQIAQNERVTALLDYLVKPTKTAQESPAAPRYLVMATKRGVIKKTPLEDFANVRRNGLIALSLKKGDFLGWAKGSGGTDEIMLVTKKGQAIRFNEKEVRPMGRTATGVGGIGLKNDDAVVGMTVINQGPSTKTDLSLLVLTENGFGKKTPIKSYRKQRRAGMGIKTAQITSKTGLIVAARLLDPSEEDLIAISQRGQVIRVVLSSVPKLGRQTQGVRIMKLDDDDVVASATCV